MPKPSTSKSVDGAEFGMVVGGVLFKAALLRRPMRAFFGQVCFMVYVVEDFCGFAEDVTAKKFDGMRYWKVVASSDGRNDDN